MFLFLFLSFLWSDQSCWLMPKFCSLLNTCDMLVLFNAFSDISIVLIKNYLCMILPKIRIYIYSTLPSWARCDSKVNFLKWNTAGLNSEFSFSLTGCFPKAKEPSLPIAEGRKDGFIPFLKWNANNFIQDLNFSCWILVATITEIRESHWLHFT